MQTIFEFEDPSKDILVGLNEAQKEAVIHERGPLLIVAGAGTGKTTVITRRIAYLVAKKIAKPSEIIALTFTEKAAAEMEERVDALVPYGFTDMWISTFHAFGDRLIRDYALDLGLPANFRVLAGTEQAIFLRQNIYAFDLKYFRPTASPLSHIQALLTHFSRLKDELISGENYLQFAQGELAKAINSAASKEEIIEAEKTVELANAYLRYNDLMVQAGNLDFGDQLFLTYRTLKENSRALKECQNRFKYILVDEFQDTNYAQNEVVKLLASKNQNITVVGDDDQSIYRFRGASISNILDFKTSFPNTKEIVLNQNYRSTQEILDSSYKLIQHNNPDRLEIKNKIDKKLLSPKNGPSPELIHCDTLSCEADSVAEKILELKKDGYKFNDIALLVRANNQADPFIQSFNYKDIPYLFSGASNLFDQPEIKMLVAFLKCLAYDDDTLAFFQLATSELYNIKNAELSQIYTRSRRQNRTVYEIIRGEFTGESDVMKTYEDILKFRQIVNRPIGEVLYQYLSELGYIKKLSALTNPENETKINHIAKFFDRIAQFQHTSPEKSVLAFLENLELILEVGDEVQSFDLDTELDAVNILTVHAAKGLEWPIVFIANCVAERFPSKNKKEALPIPLGLIKERLPEGDYHLQEERRLFYVAATRAKEKLFLTAADDYGGKRSKKLSQFVLELLDEPNPAKLKHKLSPLEKIERFKAVEKKIPASFSNRFSGKEIIRLSRQQIDDYYSCPKKFYFAHILEIPLSENHYLMYGTAIHSALGYYFIRIMRNEIPTLKELVSDFEASFRNVGFITREQEEERRRQGIETLTKFYLENKDDNSKPSAVEEPFEFSENNVKINGRYDLVYTTKDDFEIRDFKTSAVKDQKDANSRIKKSTQMMIYALAWFEKHKAIPKTTLYFIESGLKGEIIFSMKDLEATKKMIFEVANGIKSNEMTAKSDKRQCSLCPYKDICPEAL